MVAVVMVVVRGAAVVDIDVAAVDERKTTPAVELESEH
jgi:hypothetical protein